MPPPASVAPPVSGGGRKREDREGDVVQGDAADSAAADVWVRARISGRVNLPPAYPKSEYRCPLCGHSSPSAPGREGGEKNRAIASPASPRNHFRAQAASGGPLLEIGERNVADCRICSRFPGNCEFFRSPEQP